MAAVIKHLKTLYEQELYSSVIPVVSIQVKKDYSCNCDFDYFSVIWP